MLELYGSLTKFKSAALSLEHFLTQLSKKCPSDKSAFLNIFKGQTRHTAFRMFLLAILSFVYWYHKDTEPFVPCFHVPTSNTSVVTLQSHLD